MFGVIFFLIINATELSRGLEFSTGVISDFGAQIVAPNDEKALAHLKNSGELKVLAEQLLRLKKRDEAVEIAKKWMLKTADEHTFTVDEQKWCLKWPEITPLILEKYARARISRSPYLAELFFSIGEPEKALKIGKTTLSPAKKIPILIAYSQKMVKIGNIEAAEALLLEAYNTPVPSPYRLRAKQLLEQL